MLVSFYTATVSEAMFQCRTEVDETEGRMESIREFPGNFNEWIRSACGSLCRRPNQRRHNEKTFQAVASVCFLDESFSSAIFPYCVADSVLNGGMTDEVAEHLDVLVKILTNRITSEGMG